MPADTFGPVMGMVCGGLFALIGVGVCGLLLWMAQKAANNAAVVKNTPVSDIGGLKSGLRKVKGKVVIGEDEDPLVSPLTKTECAYFHFQVLERRTRTVTSGGGGPHGHRTTRTETYWHPIVNDQQAVDAVVEDGTGEVELDLLKAEMVLSESAHTQSGTFDDAPEHLRRTLAKRYGVSTKGLLFNKSMKYEETILCEGDKVVVVGTATAGGKRDNPSIGKGKEHPFIVSDKSSSGTVKHFEQRALWMRIGGVVVGVLFLAGGAFAAVMAFQMNKGVNPPLANAPNNFGANNAGLKPNPPFGGGGMAVVPQPKAEDPIDKDLREMKSNDFFERGRAADDLGRMDPVPARKAEVVAALRALQAKDAGFVVEACQRALDKWDPQIKGGR